MSVQPHPTPDERALPADVLARRRVAFEGAVNFRDVGGYAAAGGRVTRWGRLYRSDALDRLTSSDLVAFRRLGIRAVYDLRGDDERARRPNPVASEQIALESGVPRQEFVDGSILETAADAEGRLCEVYLAILATAAPLFGRLYASLAAEGRLPAVIHCAGGKDRTGLASALLLGWLGVDRETVLDDYELTDRSQTAARHAEVLARFVSLGMSEAAAGALLSSPRWVMATALDTVEERYGGVDTYLREAGGLTAATLETLSRLLLEEAPAPSAEGAT